MSVARNVILLDSRSGKISNKRGIVRPEIIRAKYMFAKNRPKNHEFSRFSKAFLVTSGNGRAQLRDGVRREQACSNRRQATVPESLRRTAEGVQLSRALIPIPSRRCSPALRGLPSARSVQRDGRADQGLERPRINLVALANVDGAPHVAVQTRVEKPGRVLQ
jgi:hypothetical protein